MAAGAILLDLWQGRDTARGHGRGTLLTSCLHETRERRDRQRKRSRTRFTLQMHSP